MINLKNNFEIVTMQPSNTTSVLLAQNDECVIFDPWGRAADWEKLLDSRGLKLVGIYATHGHPDHISAAPDLAARYDVDWYMSHLDMDLIEWGNGLLEYFKLPIISGDFKRPTDLIAGTHTVMDRFEMHIIPMPGHTRGGVAFWFPNDKILLVGDSLFQDSYGRTDLPGGDEDDLFKSIHKIYEMNLPDDTIVVHGHGMHTTIGWQKQHNRFFR